MTKFTTRRGALSAGVFLALAAAVAGCSGPLLSRPAPQLYTLTPKSKYPADLPTVDWQLGVDRPTSPAGLATSRIAVARTPYAIDYYAGVLWIDDAPSMVQRLLVESFENSGKIVGVGRDSVALRSDFVLQMELREFQAEYAEGADVPTINARINVKLVKMPERYILATTTAERRVTAGDNRMISIVAAFDDALGRVLRDIVIWTLTRPEIRA